MSLGLAGLGSLSPQVDLGCSYVSQAFPHHHHHCSRPGLAFSHRVSVCWWSQKQWVGAGRPDGVCEAVSVGSVRQGMEVLSHKACSVSPGSWARSSPSTTTCWTPSHTAPGKGAPGGAKQRLQGQQFKGGKLGRGEGMAWTSLESGWG